jgi:hypothetical protein
MVNQPPVSLRKSRKIEELLEIEEDCENDEPIQAGREHHPGHLDRQRDETGHMR